MYNRRFKSILLSGLAVAVLSAGTANAAPASGTAAGTQINNTASVTYTVGGNAGSANSNQSSFLVDKKVNLTVAEVGGQATQTSLGATNQVTTFTVTNNTNSVQDFRLIADQQSLSIPIIGVDNFDVVNERVFVDSNGNGTYDAGVDTRTYIDELAPDATVTVFIVADIPTSPSNANFAIVSLTAVAADGGTTGTLGADLVATPLLQVDDPTKVDIVFADSSSYGDLARNGQNRAGDAYQISGTTLNVLKTATLISDPVDGIIAPKAIPGAIVQYCMRISNVGPSTANAINVSDALPGNMTYVPGSIVVGTAGVGGANCILLGTSEDDDATGADETDLYGGSWDGTTVRAMMPQVTTLVPMAVQFQATVD
jgi:uncharacterized repeat protein (TIGR01451 family)